MHGTAFAEMPAHESEDVSARPLILERRSDGRLWAVARGSERVVHVRRCFPWTEPARFVSLRDDEGDEVAFVADVAELDDESRRALELALADAGFVFDIAAVLDIEEEVELRHWRVRTRQGLRRFQTRLDDWPRPLPDGGLLIRDVTGDLYRLPVPAAIDRASRALLWAFID
jgi:hypothetical protein